MQQASASLSTLRDFLDSRIVVYCWGVLVVVRTREQETYLCRSPESPKSPEGSSCGSHTGPP
jgi:hypothetical protein